MQFYLRVTSTLKFSCFSPRSLCKVTAYLPASAGVISAKISLAILPLISGVTLAFLLGIEKLISGVGYAIKGTSITPGCPSLNDKG